jgi:pSer/pThr/pTyr-binding forkhead associated (FHA) protein
MKPDPRRAAEEGGTVLEPLPGLAQLVGPVASSDRRVTQAEPLPATPSTEARPSAAVEAAYRPQIRPLVPRLVILEDGESETGETLWLRDPVTVIGRSEGAVRLAHDLLVSGRHAEIVRDGAARPHRWLLRDLGSANGTFVRCSKTRLRPEAIVILGSRRFRFRPPEDSGVAVEVPEGTILADMAGLHAAQWPGLVETQSRAPLEITLNGVDLAVGRPGHGNAIEIDDPCLAPRHARIQRQASGHWSIESLPSLNGVWVQVGAIQLAPVSRFQIGEQRLLFSLASP